MEWKSCKPPKENSSKESWRSNDDTLQWAIRKTCIEPDWVKRVAGKALTILDPGEVTVKDHALHGKPW